MKTYLRKFLFIVISLLLRYPILLLLFILRPLRLFQYIFLVYPGKDKDIEGYCPLWLAKSIIYSAKPSIAGIITKSKTNARGLVLVIPNSTNQLLHYKKISQQVMDNLNMIAKIVGATTIGMAGQGPGIMSKHSIETGKKFMHGTMGTVFSISQTIDASIIKNAFSKSSKIVIVGKSFISNGLVEFLRQKGHNAIEINKSDELSPLKNADIIVALTLSGKMFYPLFPYLKENSILIDYTHPKMLKKPRNTYFYKVATGIEGVKFIPRLPGYQPKWIPGCCIESIIHSSYGDTPFNHQNLFNESAQKLGLIPLLVG